MVASLRMIVAPAEVNEFCRSVRVSNTTYYGPWQGIKSILYQCYSSPVVFVKCKKRLGGTRKSFKNIPGPKENGPFLEPLVATVGAYGPVERCHLPKSSVKVYKVFTFTRFYKISLSFLVKMFFIIIIS